MTGGLSSHRRISCGMRSDGAHVVYAFGGSIYSFDATDNQTTTLATGGDSCYTGSVSSSGEVAYLANGNQVFVAGP